MLYLGIAAGIGFIVSGLSAALPRIFTVSRLLGTIGTAGVFLFLAWAVAAGVRLLAG